MTLEIVAIVTNRRGGTGGELQRVTARSCHEVRRRARGVPLGAADVLRTGDRSSLPPMGGGQRVPARDLFHNLASVSSGWSMRRTGGGGAADLFTVVLGEEGGRMMCPAIAMAARVQTDMATPGWYDPGTPLRGPDGPQRPLTRRSARAGLIPSPLAALRTTIRRRQTKRDLHGEPA